LLSGYKFVGAASGDKLGWLWQKQGKQEKARQILAEIYGWFTEEFETVVLRVLSQS